MAIVSFELNRLYHQKTAKNVSIQEVREYRDFDSVFSYNTETVKNIEFWDTIPEKFKSIVELVISGHNFSMSCRYCGVPENKISRKKKELKKYINNYL
jgi:hypothetical protein